MEAFFLGGLAAVLCVALADYGAPAVLYAIRQIELMDMGGLCVVFFLVVGISVWLEAMRVLPTQ
jgi:hypothetical protein